MRVSNQRNSGQQPPIIFIGSGKTAMDCIYHLCHGAGLHHQWAGSAQAYKDRIHCIAGRGMMFCNRDVMFPEGFWERNSFLQMSAADWFLEILTRI